MSEQWTKIVVARHGETRQNMLNLLLSRQDVPLNRNGRTQAAHLHDALSDHSFSTCYSSPLSRAYETAWLTCSEDVPVHLDKRIIERDFGKLEGRCYIETTDERQQFLQHNKKSWLNNPKKNPHKIETDAELNERVIPFLKEIAVAHLGLGKGEVLVTSHSGILRYLLNYLGYSYEQTKGKKIPNCGYLVLESNGEKIRLAGVDDSPEFQWLRELVVY